MAGKKLFRKGEFRRKSLAITANIIEVNWTKRGRKPTSLTDYKRTEAYLQHWLFHKLQLHKIDSIPEFREHPNRYDLVVLKQGKPICIVEVKSRWTKAEEQCERYENNSWRVPVFLLAGAEQGKFIFERILTLYAATKLASGG